MNVKSLGEEHYQLRSILKKRWKFLLFTAIVHFINKHQRKLRELIAIAVTLPGLVDPVLSIIQLHTAHYRQQLGIGR